MKQVLCSPCDGEIRVADVPAPHAGPGRVLVRTRASLVSAGTERQVVEFARKSWLEKARARPDLVREALSKAQREGFRAAYDAVRSRLDRPAALGYSSAGTILEVGAQVTDFEPGDRVACAGAGCASHAEIVSVPRNLVVRIPEPSLPRTEPVDFEEAAFAALGAIAMHGLRLAEPQLGETVAVIGLGLAGLLAAQLARAAGCAVFGLDPDRARCRLAEALGCAACSSDESGFESLVDARTEGMGADAVIVAAATPGDGPLRLAGNVARSRARLVVVGAVGMRIPRRVYYEKELVLRVSRSCGPGRYDREYEEHGRDYPAGYVRWTENRNLGAFLALLARGRLEVLPLITHRMPACEAARAYDLLLGRTEEPYLGLILTYPASGAASRRACCAGPGAGSTASTGAEFPRIGLVGAGNFALGVLLPALRGARAARLVGVCAASGASAEHAARKFGFQYATTGPDRIFADRELNTVVIATPHRCHGEQVLAALAAGKHVFCEKPLCISEAELADIVRACARAREPKPRLTVGFNRRFSPMARALRHALAERTGWPLILQYRINAGRIPEDGWAGDEEQGGRVVGEVCHFVDLLTFLTGSLPVRVYARRPAPAGPRDDSTIALLEFANGSAATIAYAAGGDRRFSKERLEVFCGGLAAAIEDFRLLEVVCDGRRKKMVSRFRQDKGHRAECQAFAAALGGGEPLIPFEEIVSTTLTTFRILESQRRGQPVEVRLGEFLASAVDASGEVRGASAAAAAAAGTNGQRALCASQG